jgi:Zn-finger nucleic acid-binding protein
MRLKSDMESLRCEYCQSVYLPDKNDDGVRVLDEQADEQCPLCNQPLVHAVLAKCPILYCKKCGGMLVAMGALEELLAELRAEVGSGAKPSAYDKDELSRTIQCPHCHRRMEAHLYAGPGNVVIDSCQECCMIWMDRGEAKRIASGAEVCTQPESFYSDEFDPPPVQSSSGLGQQSLVGFTVDSVISGIIESIF